MTLSLLDTSLKPCALTLLSHSFLDFTVFISDSKKVFDRAISLAASQPYFKP